jgi:hypothetical protein
LVPFVFQGRRNGDFRRLQLVKKTPGLRPHFYCGI